MATLLGRADEDVRISDVLVTASGSGEDYYTVNGEMNCGGIVGEANFQCSIERCVFSGVIKGTILRSGGILGYGYNGVTISDCSASYYIDVTTETLDNSLGGIVGKAAKALQHHGRYIYGV